jgi:hypothetical protein
MTRAILVNFHLYTTFGKEFYNPILDYFLKQMREYQNEYDHLYLLDSNWEIESEKIKDMKASIVRTNPSMRYYDCFKEVLPQIKKDLVLFMDNDMVVYKEGIIKETFNLFEYDEGFPPEVQKPFDVVSITDTIGTMKVPLKTGNKLCPYFFATRKELLMKYLDVDWGPDAMPYTETFGLLTEALLKDGAKVYEMEDDKTGIYFDGAQDGEKGKDLGYYHIRAGSTPAYLLATRKYGDQKTYWDYLKHQPTREYLRQACWYKYMGGQWEWALFDEYYEKFLKYHNLP